MRKKLFQSFINFDEDWYRSKYSMPRRDRGGLVKHYINFGRENSYNINQWFDERHYRSRYPDVTDSNCNPFEHFVLNGRREKRSPLPQVTNTKLNDKEKKIQQLRFHLESYSSLEAREALVNEATKKTDYADMAAEVLAFWELARSNPDQSCIWFKLIFDRNSNTKTQRRLAPIYTIAQRRAGIECKVSVPESTELCLSNITPDTDETEIQTILNELYQRHGMSLIEVLPGQGAIIDRLTTRRCFHIEEGPTVSVILAVRNGGETVDTAISSILNQTWRNLELVIVDDGSDDDTWAKTKEWSDKDSRVVALRNSTNIGAYASRNRAVQQVRGDYISLQDADDWSHPQRIEKQIKKALTERSCLATIASQLRVSRNIEIMRWTGTGEFIHECLPSLLMPTEIMKNILGAWDTVKFGADSELIRRFKIIFGESSVETLKAPTSLQAVSQSSLTESEASGMDYFYHGPRLDYYQSQKKFHHTHRALLPYMVDKSAFSVSKHVEPKGLK